LILSRRAAYAYQKTRARKGMQRVVLYHNPSCGNSRGALQKLRDQKVEFDLIEYLKSPPDRATLEKILAMLESPPADLVRKDKRFEELKLRATDYTSKEQVTALLIKHPELMQRPIVVRGNRAVIARPPDKLDALF
jgi:arsenate reductase (glutaredoxin)